MQKNEKIYNTIEPCFKKYKDLSRHYKSIQLNLRLENLDPNLIKIFTDHFSKENEKSFFMQITHPGETSPLKSICGINIENFLCTYNENPITQLRDYLTDISRKTYFEADISHSGVFGYISYESYKYFDKTPLLKSDPTNCPESYFLFPKTMVSVNHKEKNAIITTLINGHNSDTKHEYEKGCEIIRHLADIITTSFYVDDENNFEPLTNHKEIKPITNKNGYIKNIGQIKSLIKEGELIQCVLSQRFEKEINCDDNYILEYLNKLYPSEYVFQFKAKHFSITGSSPEMFLRVKDKKATVRPVAGTAGIEPQTSRSYIAKKLRDSIKDRAEHIMLVDLSRNDLGRVCKKGTVAVEKLLEIQIYRNLVHLVSEISGIIDERFDPLDAFMANFPIGTLVGAPKIRAAEIIAQLEREGRGPYCGAIGWFSCKGEIETSTLIRSAIKKNGKISFNGGGGIVFDSDPEVEYQETLFKTEAFRRI